jgi:hypothetical protein
LSSSSQISNGSIDGLRLQLGPIYLPGRDFVFLLQISVDEPPPTAVSIVVDQSDSCNKIAPQLDTCLKLIQALPRNCPVRIFRLSQAEPIRETTVADICDGAVKIKADIDESNQDATVKQRGSFLKPCIEYIELKLKGMRNICFVLTDGQLTDFGGIRLPSWIKVVGLTGNKAEVETWRNVIPDSPVYEFRDSRIDQTIKPSTQPFWGMVEVSMEGIDLRSGLLYRVTRNNRLLNLAELPTQEINFSREDAIFALMLSPDEIRAVRVKFQANKTAGFAYSKLVELKTVGFDNQIPERLIEQVSSAFLSNSQSNSLDLLFDIDCEDAEFPDFQQFAKTAIKLADDKNQWELESSFQSLSKKVLVEDIRFGRIFKCDAMLCIFGLDTNDEPQRIVGIALQKHQQPAVKLLEDSISNCQLRRPIQINYNKSDYRWYLKVAENPEEELESYSSDRLRFEDIELASGIAKWTLIFSGDLI